ncbi:putative high mobility group protein [Erysiphe neolycopersici]|uniref:Putative high mobility group protein n=1 Tax=Erysiphe neolycopersici TaxID=212602 RepID=A0A420HU72_9PEZI|nr:putative high mobility group protein [Erysiphe neolycopersici]
MARAKKSEEKGGAILQIDVDSFVRTRDSIVTGLQTLQDAIRILSSAYIKHTNAILGEHGTCLDVDAALAKLGEIPLLRLGDDLGRTNSPGKQLVENFPEKKERKKRQFDPNAPKRPLTPFFLYMQTARRIIADDLGANVPKGAVGAEGQRRWQTMSDEDKQLWADAYKDNLRLYHARIHAYKAGNLNAKDMSETEAAQYAIKHNITVPALEHPADTPLVEETSAAAFLGEDVDAETELIPEPEFELQEAGTGSTSGSTSGSESDPEPEPEPEAILPPKTPKSKSSRKQKSKTSPNETPILPKAILPIITNPASIEKEKSLEKKRKRSKRKDELNEKEKPSIETQGSISKTRKKRTKNE